MIFILNRNEKVINVLKEYSGADGAPTFFDDVFSQELSTGAETFQFSTLDINYISSDLVVGNYVAFQDQDKNFKLFQITQVETYHEDSLYIRVFAECAGLELLNSVFRSRNLVSCNLERFVKSVTEDTSWTLGSLFICSTSLDLELDNENVYSLLQRVIPLYGGELSFRVEIKNGRIVGKYVDVVQYRGKTTGKRFTFGRDIQSLSRKVDSSELFTALIGVGNNGITFKEIQSEEINKPLGQDFVVDEEAYKRYNSRGYHLMGLFHFDTDSPEELLLQTHKELQKLKTPKVEYEVSVALLNELLGNVEDKVRIGDTVAIVDNYFNPPIHLMARVSKLEKSFSNPNSDTCTLANFVEVKSNITDEMRKLASELEGFVNSRFPIGTNDIQNGAVTGDKIYRNTITTDHLIADSIDANKIKAESIESKHIKADQIEAEHIKADQISTNHLQAQSIDATKIQADSIQSEHIVANAIKSKHIDTGSITTDKLEAGSVTADKIQAGSITAGSGIIADGAIGSAQISYLEANKIRSGTIDTSLVTISGAEGHVEISGNQIMVNDKGKNRVTMGEYRTGKGDEVKFGLLVRDEDGETVMIDGKGVHNAGITDGAIDDNKVSDSANISGTKLNINSVIREVNENGTESIKGTRVVVGDRSLEVELSEQQNTITEHGKEISTQKSEIKALDDQIKLKVDNQTFTEATNTINNKIDATKDEVKEENKVYTDLQIDYVNKGLQKNTSEINILKDEISTKVTQADIDRTVANIKLGGRNLILNSKVEESSNENEFAIRKALQLNSETTYTLSANACMKNNNSSSQLVIILSPDNGSWEQTLVFEPNGKTEIKEVTFSTTENVGENIIVKATCRPSAISEDSSVATINWYKLEEGTKATDWTPAPEDIDGIITDKIQIVEDKINTVESSINQTLDGIKLNVNSLDSKTTQIETNVNVVNRDLSSKIDENLQVSKDYANNVALSKSEEAKQEAIELASQDATNKANQAQENAMSNSKEYTNVQISATNSKISGVESGLNVLKEKIESKVSQSDIDKSISNIQLGGRNYVRYSNFSSLVPATNNIKGWNVWGDISVFFNQGKPNYNVNGVVYLDAIKGGGIWQEISADLIKPNEDYTLSLLLGQEANVRDCPCYIEFWNNDVKVKAICLFGNTGYLDLKRRSYTFKTINEPYTSIRLVFVHNGSQNGNGCLLQVGLIKLEKGNKAGDWTIATEDTDSKIQDSIKVTDEKINKVSSTVTQLKDSVTTEISSLKSKTQTIESNLDGKASKSEVQELNTQVAQQKVSLDGITNRVGETETKTSQLEGSLSEVNRDLTGKINSGVQNAKDFATNQVNQAKDEIIDIASQDATNKANQAQENAINGANSYTDVQVNITNNKVSSVESSLNILKDKVETKVSQSDIDKSIANIQLGERNLLRNTGLCYNAKYWYFDTGIGRSDNVDPNLALNNHSIFFNVSGITNDSWRACNPEKVSCLAGEVFSASVMLMIPSSDNRLDDGDNIGALEIQFWDNSGNRIRTETTTFRKSTITTDRWYKIVCENRVAPPNAVKINARVWIRRNGRFWAGNLKLVKGKTISDWTPAPEDSDTLVVDNVNVVNEKISQVSSSVTQLRDSVTTQISSLNTKTQTIESNLNGKATKTEVQNVKDQVASVEIGLSGITNRVSNTESNINSVNDKIQNTVTKSEFTEFKQNTDSFKFTVEQRSSINNLVPNSSFEGAGRAWTCNGEFWAGSYTGYDFKGRFCGAIKNSNRYNNERYLMSEKCFKVKKNTTYTLNFKFALEQNVDSMDAFVILSDSESTNYGQAIHMYNASGGSQTNNWQEECVSKTFNTGNYEWVWLRFDHNGMRQGVNVHEWCWLYISEVGVYEGDVGQVKWVPSGGESYSSNFLLDSDGFRANFDDGSYTYLGKEGFEWFNAGTGHRYHCLMTTGVVNHLDFNGGNRHHRVTLPAEFRGKKFKIQSMIQGWNFPSGSVSGTMASGVQDFDYANAQFTLYFNGGGDWKTNCNIAYVVIA